MAGSMTVRFQALPSKSIAEQARALAAIAGEDLVVAVAVHVGDPEGVAVLQGRVDHGPGAELRCANGSSVRLGRRPHRCRARARPSRGTCGRP